MAKNNIGQFFVLALGIVLIFITVKIIFENDVMSYADIVTLVIGFCLGIPLIIGSIIIMRKKEELR